MPVAKNVSVVGHAVGIVAEIASLRGKSEMARYDVTGTTYRSTRKPDARIMDLVTEQLHDARSVINVGAGCGSYEPDSVVAAVEPSMVMISQRPEGSAPAVCGVAESLPFADDSADACSAILTIHHWSDLARGIAELARVARERLVILTWDHRVAAESWLLRDYFPAAAATDRALAVPMDTLVDLLPASTVVHRVLVPADCTDGFGGAFWRRPRAYLDRTVRNGMSLFTLTPEPDVSAGLTLLSDDLDSGEWERRYADLLTLDAYDFGYRLVVADL